MLLSSFVVKDLIFFKNNKGNDALDSFSFNNFSVFDFFDKKKSHFSTHLPYQFLYRTNRSYDCFLLSMYYDLLLTYYICYFNLGSTVKARVDFPFYKFNRWFPFKLKTNKLVFWLDLRFLVFNSYSKFINYDFSNLSFIDYIGYFPISFYNSYFDLKFFGLRFSPIANEVNFYRNRFYRKRFNVEFDIDYHISLYLGKGIVRLGDMGLINFFRYLVPEYFFIHGMDQSYISLVQTGYEGNKVVITHSFFKKRFFFSFFKNFRKGLFLGLFNSSFFSLDFYFGLVDFYFVFFFKRISNFFRLYFFFNFVCFFVSNFLFFFLFKAFYKFYLIFKYFLFDFLFLFFFIFKLYNFFILFYRFFFRFLFYKFFSFFFFSKTFFFFRFNVGVSFFSFAKKRALGFFSNLYFLKFKVLNFYKNTNPFLAVNFCGLFKFSGYKFYKFEKVYFNSKVTPSMVYFTFLIFIKFFYFLFFFIFKSSFISSFLSFDFYSTRIYFFN